MTEFRVMLDIGLMATATVTGELLGTPNDAMRAQLGGGEPKLFTPWMAAHD